MPISVFPSFLICLLTLICWGRSAFAQIPDPKNPFVLGVIDTLHSAALGETRTLNIYLPSRYSRDSMNRYPVIYLLDGSADEDFVHVAGLAQYASFPWVNLLPESIVVGIANVDRRRDFTYPTSIERDKKDFPTTGHSDSFIAFIERELMPYVQKTYSNNPGRTLIGQSLGGLLATEILFRKPAMFTRYVVVSPSLWWDNESLLTRSAAFKSPSFQQPTQIFVAVGKEGRVMETDARRLVSLLNTGANPTMQVHFQYFPDENHASIFHLAVYRALQAFRAAPTTPVKTGR